MSELYIHRQPNGDEDMLGLRWDEEKRGGGDVYTRLTDMKRNVKLRTHVHDHIVLTSIPMIVLTHLKFSLNINKADRHDCIKFPYQYFLNIMYVKLQWTTYNTEVSYSPLNLHNQDRRIKSKLLLLSVRYLSERWCIVWVISLVKQELINARKQLSALRQTCLGTRHK